MLHTLYRLTSHFPAFHQTSRHIISLTEVPLIRKTLMLAGAHKVILRNSAKDGHGFNVFMSDLDLSVVSDESNFLFLHQISKDVKKIFPNLGEIEFYTPEEWQIFSALLVDSHSVIWDRLLRLRKLIWQKKALKEIHESNYQKAKLQRGILTTSRKLGINSQNFNLDELFPELSSAESETLAPGSYSAFLDMELAFHDERSARNFWSILPDSRNIPQNEWRKDLKLYILKREYFLTLVSIRSDIFTGKIADLTKKNAWLSDLKSRIGHI